MVPLIKKSADTLVELFSERTKTGESFDFFKYVKKISDVKQLLNVLCCLIIRTYGSFTMETILATAFGRVVDVQRGESDELTRAANTQFRRAEEGNSTSRSFLLVLISKYLRVTAYFKKFLQVTWQNRLCSR